MCNVHVWAHPHTHTHTHTYIELCMMHLACCIGTIHARDSSTQRMLHCKMQTQAFPLTHDVFFTLQPLLFKHFSCCYQVCQWSAMCVPSQTLAISGQELKESPSHGIAMNVMHSFFLMAVGQLMRLTIQSCVTNVLKPQQISGASPKQCQIGCTGAMGAMRHLSTQICPMISMMWIQHHQIKKINLMVNWNLHLNLMLNFTKMMHSASIHGATQKIP